jgi:hypothetical protein
MINYTECITLLMHDVVARVPDLGFIDLDEVLVFARFGRSGADGSHATCHSFNLPTSEPGYYFWRDRKTGKLTRRSEWFVTKSPDITIGEKQISYLISFALPRFCDQSLEHSRKAGYYLGAAPWVAKLDTVVHELYHIDPRHSGIRQMERADGGATLSSHGAAFFFHVAEMVRQYLATKPDPGVYEFLKYDFVQLNERYGGVLATTFRNFPSFPKRYNEPLPEQPAAVDPIKIEPLPLSRQPHSYTEADLCVRQFYLPSLSVKERGAFLPSQSLRNTQHVVSAAAGRASEMSGGAHSMRGGPAGRRAPMKRVRQ